MAGVIPKHVAIIPDGNRRWARQRSLKPWEGHQKAGASSNLKPILDEAEKLGIKYVSLWGFSTENWKRDKKEVEILMRVILQGLNDLEEIIDKDNLRVVHVGRKDRLLKKLVDRLEYLENKTKGNSGTCIMFCLDYGGRDEIVRAANRAIGRGKTIGSESEFVHFLDTPEFPDPDLIIRTGGEMRLSGFMPFQSVYSELYFIDKFFPDFGPADLRKAIKVYGERQRRYGA